MPMQSSTHIYEVRPCKDKHGVDLISDVLPFGTLCYGDTNAVANAVGYAEHCSRSNDAVIRVYNDASNVIEMHESGSHLYRKPYASAQCVWAAGDCSTLTMIK